MGIDMKMAIDQAIQVLYSNPNPATNSLDRVISWFLRYKCQEGKTILSTAKELYESLGKVENSDENKAKKILLIKDRLGESIKLMEEYNTGKDENLAILKDRGLVFKITTITQQQVPF